MKCFGGSFYQGDASIRWKVKRENKCKANNATNNETAGYSLSDKSPGRSGRHWLVFNRKEHN